MIEGCEAMEVARSRIEKRRLLARAKQARDIASGSSSLIDQSISVGRVSMLEMMSDRVDAPMLLTVLIIRE